MNEQEAQWISGSLAGEASSYEALYDAHARRIAAYFARSGFARADADDLVQETFVRAFRSLHTFDAGRGAFGAWLAAIARNVARKRWARRGQPEHFDPELAQEVLICHDNPGHVVARREEIEALGDCIERLPEELGRIVRLRYVDGRTTRGVAAATGIPEATVRLRLAEAHQKLQQCLEAKGVLA